jgi:hypothetical protein
VLRHRSHHAPLAPRPQRPSRPWHPNAREPVLCQVGTERARPVARTIPQTTTSTPASCTGDGSSSIRTRSGRSGRPLRSAPPAALRAAASGEGHEHHLDVAEHGGQTSPHAGDRVVPEDEVRGEEGPCDPGERPGAEPSGAVAPALPERDREQRRDGVGTAVEGGGGRRHVREPDEDPGEGDARRPGDEQGNRPCAQKPAERAPLTIRSRTIVATTIRYQTKIE